MTIALLVIGCVAVWLAPARYRLAVWVIVIIAVVTPWRTFQDHAHWSRVRWVPFVSPPVRVGDIVGNILLYVPFGLLYARRRQKHAVLGWAVRHALLLSGSTEFTQLFSHGRFPSVQDILMNVIGAVAGITIARLRTDSMVSADVGTRYGGTFKSSTTSAGTAFPAPDDKTCSSGASHARQNHHSLLACRTKRSVRQDSGSV